MKVDTRKKNTEPALLILLTILLMYLLRLSGKVGEVKMILELTEIEKIVLLGLLEDIAQAEDVNEACPIQTRIAIKGIIQKLGGTYFGAMVT